MTYDSENWCIEEERKYIFGGTCEVFMPAELAALHKRLVDDLLKESIIKRNHLQYTEFDDGWNEALERAIEIINKRFGANL